MLASLWEGYFDNNNNNSGTLSTNALAFGLNSGEGIASNRTTTKNQFGLDFYTAFEKRLSITNMSDSYHPSLQRHY